MEQVKNLLGVAFRWKNRPEAKSQIGFIAQEVAEVYPQLVSGEEGDLSVQYANLTAVLVEAIKTQQQTIEQLENRVTQLEK